MLRLGLGGNLDVLVSEDAYDASRDFVVDDGFVVFSDDINAEFLPTSVKRA